MDISAIREPIKEELELIEIELRKTLSDKSVFTRKVLSHLVTTSGKRFRPILMCLISKLNGASPPELITAANIVELIHTATLVHDDSIDKSPVRRGLPTVNSLWSDDVAIAMGDYLYSKAFSLLVEKKFYPIMRILAETTNRMSVGEMMQLQRKHDFEITEDEYLSIIREKTASLISASCEIGAYFGWGENGFQERFSNFGDKVGIAFQIVDDLLDFLGDEKVTGKGSGNDLKEGKVTLPLIIALKNAPKTKKSKILEVVGEEEIGDGHWKEVTTFVDSYGGFEYSREKAKEFGGRARNILSDFDPSPIREALNYAVDYVVERNS
jgi:octaprenyl-diphosphate synthase